MNGSVMRAARLRFERRRGFAVDSSIELAFYHKKPFEDAVASGESQVASIVSEKALATCNLPPATNS